MCEIVKPDEMQVTNLPQICAHTTPSEVTTEERRFENINVKQLSKMALRRCIVDGYAS